MLRLILVLTALVAGQASGQTEVTLLRDTVLDANALLFASNAPYGRAINGLAFQTEALLTVGEYQYSSWYHFGSGGSQNVYLARRLVDGTTWEVMDTGADMTRTTSDAHNVISMGVSSGGAINLAYDHHGNPLRSLTTAAGAATASVWNATLFGPERSSLNPGGAPIDAVTYPRFFNDPTTGGLFMTYRVGGSGSGDIMFAAYDEAKGMWAAPHEIIDGRDGILYTDPQGSSTTRNPYLNGIDIDVTGRIHVTWTWRESAGGTNHDILYASSDDGGWTWRNGAGDVVGTAGSPIRIDKSGLMIDDGDPANGSLGQIDRRNTLMNQQTQAVDRDGRVHLIMWHADDANANTVSGFTTAPAAYFHYFRDPVTGGWERRELPTTFAVGSRPDMACDPNGNLYVAYVSPGPGDAGGYYTDGGLVIATASKVSGYSDWEIAAVDARDFAGEPRLDPTRLSRDGVVSVFLQENSDLVSSRTGTPLHVLDYAALGNKLVWAGDDASLWTTGSGNDWDNDGNGLGDNRFEAGDRLIFSDAAESSAVTIAEEVAPGSMTFENSAAHGYSMIGAGIGGAGGLVVRGGGTVRLENAANSFEGETRITSGILELAGAATLASRSIAIEPSGQLDVSGLANGLIVGAGQTLSQQGSVGIVGNTADGAAIVSYAAPGDVDLSGTVNVFDLVSINSSGTYGTAAASVWSTGDFNYDNVTNVFDLVSINTAAAYGQGNYFPSAPSAVGLGGVVAVPEPAAWLMLGGCGLAGLLARRSRRSS